MARKFRLKTFRKPKHWSKERYEEYLKENKMEETELQKERKLMKTSIRLAGMSFEDYWEEVKREINADRQNWSKFKKFMLGDKNSFFEDKNVKKVAEAFFNRGIDKGVSEVYIIVKRKRK